VPLEKEDRRTHAEYGWQKNTGLIDFEEFLMKNVTR